MKHLFIGLFLFFQSAAFAGGHRCQLNNTCGEGFELSNSLPVIQCGTDDRALRVKLSQHFGNMPLYGRVPARLENFPLPLGNYVSMEQLPSRSRIFLNVETAYCGYTFQVAMSQRGHYEVMSSAMDCEGKARPLQCKLL